MNNVLKVTMDPTGKHEKRTHEWLLEAMGLIPYFAVESASKLPETAGEALEHMDKAYGFGMGPMSGPGTVTPEGVYQYPEDPDLYPYAHFRFPSGGIEVFVYPYAFVAVRDSKTTLVTRMD